MGEVDGADGWLTPEIESFDSRYGGMLAELNEAGWVIRGSRRGDWPAQSADICLGLPIDISRFTFTDALADLQITDPEGGLLPGFDLDVEVDGQATVGYTGPLDGAFEGVIRAMVGATKQVRDEGPVTRERLSDDFLRAQVHVSAEDLRSGELPDNVRELLVAILDTPVPVLSAVRYISLYRDDEGVARTVTNLMGTDPVSLRRRQR